MVVRHDIRLSIHPLFALSLLGRALFLNILDGYWSLLPGAEHAMGCLVCDPRCHKPLLLLQSRCRSNSETGDRALRYEVISPHLLRQNHLMVRLLWEI